MSEQALGVISGPRVSKIAVAKRRVRIKKRTREMVVEAYREDTERKRLLILKSNATRNQLALITRAMRELVRDERFMSLLKIEKLDTIPGMLAARMDRQGHFLMTKKAKRKPAETAFERKQASVSNPKNQPRNNLCSEAIELLKDKHVCKRTFIELNKLIPTRQVEAAQLMVAMNKYSVPFVKSLVNATPSGLIVPGTKRQQVRGLTPEQIALMKRESTNLDREFCLIEESYGEDRLDLVVAVGYVLGLIENARVVRYLAQNFSELLSELQKIAESHKATARPGAFFP